MELESRLKAQLAREKKAEMIANNHGNPHSLTFGSIKADGIPHSFPQTWPDRSRSLPPVRRIFNYAGAIMSRLTSDWLSSQASADAAGQFAQAAAAAASGADVVCKASKRTADQRG